MNKSIFSVLLLCVFAHTFVHAQKGIELGGWLGAATYYGDLKPKLNLDNVRPAGGIIFRHNFNNRISYKGSLNYMRLSAEDSDATNTFQQTRNLSFFSDIYDMSHQMEFNFLPFNHGSEVDFYTPYLFGGLSSFFYNPKAKIDFNQDGTNEVYTLRNLGTEGQILGGEYGRFSMAVNFGIGLKFDINVDWSINIEFMGRSTFTDYLDDVSTVYPDRNRLSELRGEIAVALSDRSDPSLDIAATGNQRGNARDRDYIYTFGISIMRFFGQLPCPKVSKNR
ncbi:MAG: DUF6089 family protein [Saprospiraceae bacterium]|nr:DUF6089 family protein [Saprospiraceae bacterium]|tara:strand:+ start:115 stop:951 length:837 start_codon:yes stop_codon:yes gene_type:complete